MSASTCSESSYNYRALIHEIAQDLSAEDTSAISFLAAVPSQRCGCCCNHGGLTSSGPRGLLELMEKRGMFSAGDLQPLMSLLREVGRHDLASKCGVVHTPLQEDVSKDGISEHDMAAPENHTPSTPPTYHTPTTEDDRNMASLIEHKSVASHTPPTPPTGHVHGTTPCCVLALSQQRLFQCDKLKHLSQKIRSGISHHLHSPKKKATMTKAFSDDYVMVDSNSLAPPHQPTVSDIQGSGLSSRLDVLRCSRGRHARSWTFDTDWEIKMTSPLPTPPCDHTHSRDRETMTSTNSPSPTVSRSLTSSSLSSCLCTSNQPTYVWKVKRDDMTGCIRNHDNKAMKRKFRVVGGSSEDNLNLTCSLTLFPNGINWDLDKAATLRVAIRQATPTHTPNGSLYFSVLGVAHGLVTEVISQRETTVQLKDENTFVINEFISHDVIELEKVKIFELSFSLNLHYELGKDWACLGGEEEEEEEEEEGLADGNEYFIIPHFP